MNPVSSNRPRSNPERLLLLWIVVVLVTCLDPSHASSQPHRARKGMVVAQEKIAAEVGRDVLREGGTAVDAAVATAFALAVTHPAAGNLGGGGFLLYQPSNGPAIVVDFRETAPASAHPNMFIKDGVYDPKRHHQSHLAVGVPGTVAGLHLAWLKAGRLPWQRLVQPAIRLAQQGFIISPNLADSLAQVLPAMKPYAASIAQFSKEGTPYNPGERLKQPDLAATLKRIAARGPTGFYQGATADLIVREIQAHGGQITSDDLKSYQAKERLPLRGVYRGFEIVSVPPPSSGGVAILETLNILEGWDLSESGFGGSLTIHRITEALRRSFADRARFLGDPDSNPALPIDRLLSKDYAASLRQGIHDSKASKSSPLSFEWPHESGETTHISVLDSKHNAVALTYTIEDSYGSKIVVSGAGFLLNNEMGDFNPQPGLTDSQGAIGTDPNLAGPRKRMLSSMSPSMVLKEGRVVLVTGSPGGRTIISTVLQTILNTIDFGMNAQECVDAPRFHHQWLPDQIVHEPLAINPDAASVLKLKGHRLHPTRAQGAAQVIRLNPSTGWIEGAADSRDPDSAAMGW